MRFFLTHVAYAVMGGVLFGAVCATIATAVAIKYPDRKEELIVVDILGGAVIGLAILVAALAAAGFIKFK